MAHLNRFMNITKFMKNSALNLINEIDYFSVPEFPTYKGKSVLEFTDADLLVVLNELRVQHDKPIYPSTLQRGWVRFKDVDKNNRHSAIDRLSDAGDIFPEGDPIKFWFLVQSFQKIGGIGIYFDTNITSKQPGPMFHIDLRPERLIWGRIDGKYYYPQHYKEQRKPFFTKLYE